MKASTRAKRDARAAKSFARRPPAQIAGPEPEPAPTPAPPVPRMTREERLARRRAGLLVSSMLALTLGGSDR